MSSPEGAATAEAHVAHHFSGFAQQTHAARLGMWLFLATEVLLFAGLFVGYTAYRLLYPEAFREGAHHLSLAMGGTNTVVLISSSLTVALGYHAAQVGRLRATVRFLAITILCALAFLVIKAFEYHHHYETGALPGRLFHLGAMAGHPGAPIFFTIYFFTTGLHAIHVIAGMSILTWLLVRTARGAFSAAYHTPIELGALYWHLVDLIWIFLFPLLYVI